MKTVRLTSWVAAAVLLAASAAAENPHGKGHAEGKAGKPQAAHPAHPNGKGQTHPQGKSSAGSPAERGGPSAKKTSAGSHQKTSSDVPGRGLGLDKERGPKRRASKDKDKLAAGEQDLEHAKERARRKLKRVDALKHRWGNSLLRPMALADQRVHARRMARLERMREVAPPDDEKTLKRIDQLIKKETDRHDRHMQAHAAPGSGAGKAAKPIRHDKNPQGDPPRPAQNDKLKAEESQQ